MPWGSEFFELLQSVVKCLFLCCRVTCYTEDASHGMSYGVNGSWRPHGFGLLRLNRDEYGWNSSGFYLSLHRNDDPMAERSTAGENDAVCL